MSTTAEETPTNDCDSEGRKVVVVTPTKASRQRESGGESEHAFESKENEDDGDGKAAASDSIVAPHYDEQVVTGDTILNCSNFPHFNNHEIVQQYGFVRWARKQHDQHNERLVLFQEWLDSEEGRFFVELERGNEKFPYGQHKGLKLSDIAAVDSEYHIRYMGALRRKNEPPNDVLSRYIDYYNDWSHSKTTREEN